MKTNLQKFSCSSFSGNLQLIVKNFVLDDSALNFENWLFFMKTGVEDWISSSKNRQISVAL